MKNRVHHFVIAMVLAASPVIAGTATGSFNVTATVLSNCNVSATDLAFGSYTSGSASPVTASTTVSVTCTPSLPYTVSLDGGTTTGSVAARAMSDGASHSLLYGLYTSNGYTTIFGDGTASTSTAGGTGTGSVQSVSVYGRIPASQFVHAGSYSDHITVTVAY